MADEARLAEHAKHNGGGEDGALRDRLPTLNGIARAGGGVVSAGGGAAGGIAAGGSPAAHRGARLTANLDDRDPDYIRENLPLTWLLTTPLVPGRGPEHGQRARAGPGAAGRQPLRRQRDARHAAVHARLLHLLRGRAALLPARPQPGAGLPGGPDPAPVRHRRGLARERSAGARRRRRPARLPGRRLGGAPPDLGAKQGRLRGPQGIHPAGARRRRADRPGGLDRRPGDGALPQPRRPAGASPARRPRCCASR